MTIKNITIDNFQREVLQATQPILVDFYADWCGHCRAIAPILQELAEEDAVQIGKLNVDDNEALSRKYGVMTIPTLALFKDGQVIKKLVGGVDKEEIEAILPH